MSTGPRPKTAVKGKIIQGTGSILARIDPEKRKASARHANLAAEKRAQHQVQEQLAQQYIAAQQKQQNQKKSRVRHKVEQSWLYWFLNASFSEMIHALFFGRKKSRK